MRYGALNDNFKWLTHSLLSPLILSIIFYIQSIMIFMVNLLSSKPSYLMFPWPGMFLPLSLLFFSRSVLSDSLWPPWTAVHQASLSCSLLKLMSIESVMPSNHLILCHPLVLLPSIFPSVRVFQWVCSLHQVFSSGSAIEIYKPQYLK